MKRLTIIVITLLISYVSIGQITKKMPYEFDNTTAFDSTIDVGDTIKLTSPIYSTYGKIFRVDTNSTGEYYLKLDSLGLDSLSDVNLTSPVNTQVLKYDGTRWVNAADSTVTALPYDSITSKPFTTSASGFRAADSSDKFQIGGANDTTSATFYVKGGLQRSVYNMNPNETEIKGGNGDIFIVESNTVATSISTFTELENGRIIYIIGRTSGNTSTINGGGDIVLGSAGAITMVDGAVISFIAADVDGSGTKIYEISRNQ